MDAKTYPVRGDCYDEMFDAAGTPRGPSRVFVDRLHTLTDADLARRQRSAELNLRHQGITFTVYGHEAGTEKTGRLICCRGSLTGTNGNVGQSGQVGGQTNQ